MIVVFNFEMSSNLNLITISALPLKVFLLRDIFIKIGKMSEQICKESMGFVSQGFEYQPKMSQVIDADNSMQKSTLEKVYSYFISNNKIK